MDKKVNEASKNKFMQIYNNIKLRKINVEILDNGTMYKVMLLLREELEMRRKQSKERIKRIENSMYNIKMYEKEIELLNKKV